ncbi:high affinity immunoglobulin gamma Fc receptor I-like isoform X2 [Haemorhous mexicanus]|uniref:high affinity immunoglobulin gamma Fc receptor I-like isoform X2 n=1 Tax=Haemorhous mexicanus TaxID=30427 RepID=UPI0028BF2875|nr:high affinity immunoglobulin gamma Fc receptor I-like isoform X2 [Haemorhous mexicanus]
MSQLLLEPPWRPAVLWDQVTLTCQGLGTAGDTTWYRDGQRWWQKGGDHVTVTLSGTYTCDRPGSGHSPPVTVSHDWLVLQVPVRELLEGDMVTLRCRGWRNRTVTSVSYREREKLREPHGGTELSLSPLQLHHSGSYSCKVLVGSWVLHESAPVTMTVHARLELQVSARELLEGDTVTLRCLRWQNNPVTGVRFYHGDEEVGRPLNGAELSLSPLQQNHSGHYSCGGRVDSGVSPWAQSAPVTVTVHVPVANATITPGALAHQVCAGDPVTLHCSVQVGSAPVTFTWLHNGQEVARGPLLELRDIDVGHSGTYQCVATNQLGQDGHRVFRALSPELELEVTPGSPWVTVAVNVGRTLLFLLLLLAVIGGCHWWHRQGPPQRRGQCWTPTPLPPSGPGLSTGPPRVSPSPAPPRDPQVTNVELSGPCEGQRDPRDCDDVL